MNTPEEKKDVESELWNVYETLTEDALKLKALDLVVKMRLAKMKMKEDAADGGDDEMVRRARKVVK